MGAPCSTLLQTFETESITANTTTPSAEAATHRHKQLTTKRSGNRVAPLPRYNGTFACDGSSANNSVSTIFLGHNNNNGSEDSLSARGSQAEPRYFQELIQSQARTIREKKLVKQFQVKSLSWDHRNKSLSDLPGALPSTPNHHGHLLSPNHHGQPSSPNHHRHPLSLSASTSTEGLGLDIQRTQQIGERTNPSDYPGSMIDLYTNLDQVNVNRLVVKYNTHAQRSKQARLLRQSKLKSGSSETPSPKLNFNSWQSFRKTMPLDEISLKNHISLVKKDMTNFQKDAKGPGQRRWSSASVKDVPPAVELQPPPRDNNLQSKKAFQNTQINAIQRNPLLQRLPATKDSANSKEIMEPFNYEDCKSTVMSTIEQFPFLTNSPSGQFPVTANSFISGIPAPVSLNTSTDNEQHATKSSSISAGHSNSMSTDFPDSYDDGNNNNITIKPTKKRRHSYSSSPRGSNDHPSDRHLVPASCQTVDCITRQSTFSTGPSHLCPKPHLPSNNSQETTHFRPSEVTRPEPNDSDAISSPPPPLIHNSKSEILLPIDDDDQQGLLQKSKTFPLTAPRYRLRDPATEFLRTIQDPASQRLTWYKPPLSVLVVKKVRDAMVIPPFLELVTWLTQEKHMVVFVEASVLNDRLVTGHAKFPAVKDKLMSFRETHDDLTDKIDFIICLGGDGTLLYASSLFQQSVPPVMAFHLGSLGFLTPFKFNNYQEQVTNVLEGHAALTLRSRLRCIILRRGQEKQLPPSHHPPLPSTFSHTASPADDKTTSQTSNSSGSPSGGGLKAPTNLLVLNEVVIDRGPSPYLSNLDLYLDGKRITSVQGDGLIVSTPTGSTAYAVAAGASMIHPSVPAIMVTPICPHSLSFRPIVVPAGVELKITVSKDSRNTAWVSFDGRMRQELKHDDSLRVTTSIYPVPSICAEDQIADWFASLDECLRWNDRKRQRHLDDVVEDDVNNSESSSPNTSMPTTPTTIGLEKEAAGGLQRVLEKGETVEDDEEEEELEPEA